MPRTQLLTPLLALAGALPLAAQTQVALHTGLAAGDRMGPHLGGRDLDGDFHDDLVIASPYADSSAFLTDNGWVQARSGATGAVIWSRRGFEVSSLFGYSMAWTSDRNGDFVSEILVGEPYWGVTGNQPGAAHILDGATGAILHTFGGDDHLEGFGWSVASNVLWTSHPTPTDLVVGAPYDDDAGANAGSFTVFHGQTLAWVTTVHGDSPGDSLGWSMSMVGDVDDFGWFDLAVGAPYADLFLPPSFTISEAGQVQVWASQKGLLYKRYGGSTGDHFGWSVARLDDVDGDGHDDFVVGSPGHDGGVTDRGKVTLMSGQGGTVAHTLVGDAARDALGTSLGWLPDVTGDGRADFVAGAPQNLSPGYARVFRGAVPPVELFTSNGEGALDRFGSHVGWAGDVNDDGIEDVGVGASRHDPNGLFDAGAVYAFSGACPGFVTYCTAGPSASGCQAAIAGAGTPSATAFGGFTLIATGVEGAKDGLFFFGTNGRQANPWGNGGSYQCVVPPVKRGGLLSGAGTSGACDGVFSQDMNVHWQLNPNKNPGAGAIVQAQLWYRDPQNTSNQTTSLSDALEFAVCP